ncbi:MAG: hypothetical protein FRX49_04076 [Trebouxia sp. A1-2]|nr:MAG: hypothetical protein FRX49_04076 [Trebouxia sp. A1-2]
MIYLYDAVHACAKVSIFVLSDMPGWAKVWDESNTPEQSPIQHSPGHRDMPWQRQTLVPVDLRYETVKVVTSNSRYRVETPGGGAPCGKAAGQQALCGPAGHQRSEKPSPDAPVGEASFAQPGQQGVVCHPSYKLQALQQGVLGNVISQGWDGKEGLTLDQGLSIHKAEAIGLVLLSPVMKGVQDEVAHHCMTTVEHSIVAVVGGCIQASQGRGLGLFVGALTNLQDDFNALGMQLLDHMLQLLRGSSRVIAHSKGWIGGKEGHWGLSHGLAAKQTGLQIDSETASKLTWKLKSSSRKARLLRGTSGVLMGMLPAAPPFGATRLALSGSLVWATKGQYGSSITCPERHSYRSREKERGREGFGKDKGGKALGKGKKR